MNVRSLSLLFVCAGTVVAPPALAQDPPRSLGDVVRAARDAAKKPQQPPGAAPAASSVQTAPPAGEAAPRPVAATGLMQPDSRYTVAAGGAEITDSKTALTWRRCAEGMSFDGSTCTGAATSFSGLSRALAHENTQSGWRVPTIDELATVTRVDPGHGKSNRAGVDLLAFPGLPATAFWSSTLYYKHRGDRDRTKVMHFDGGSVAFRDHGEGGLLLLVKADKGKPSPRGDGVQVVAKADRVVAPVPAGGARFVVSANGLEVADVTTGLVWARCPEGMAASGNVCAGQAKTFDFAGAQRRAQNAAQGVGARWRLPDAEELLTLADPSSPKRIIDPQFFPGVPSDYFWTSHRTDDQNIYAVNFYNGFKYTRYHTSQHYVRLVRDAK